MPKKKPEASCLVVFPSGKSIKNNVHLGLSYTWSSKLCKRNCPFIGLYELMTIKYVGKVEAITVRLIPLTQVRLYVVGVARRFGPRFFEDCLA